MFTSDSEPRDHQLLALLEQHLADLRVRLQHARGLPGSEDHGLVVGDLEAAYEELLVADAEIRAQEEKINRLTQSGGAARWAQQQVVSLVPVPTLSVDGHGRIAEANQAAADLLGRQISHLVGKPVMSLFTLDERPALRTQINNQARNGHPFQQATSVYRRDGSTVHVEVLVLVGVAGPAEAEWIVVPVTGGTGAELTARLPSVLARFVSLPAREESLQGVITAAAALCKEALGPDADLALSVGQPGSPTALASTSTEAQQVDGAQARCGQGPSETAYSTSSTVLSTRLRDDPRWPRLARHVPGAVLGALAVPIVGADATRLGVLQIYGTGHTDLRGLTKTGELLAATLAAVLHELELTSQLRGAAHDLEQALTSRAVIDQAKGIVMAERGCTADEAFEHLARVSRTQHIKLRDLAQQLVDRRSSS